MEYVRLDQEDIEPNKVENIDNLIHQAHIVTLDDFLVDDNEFEDNTLEEYKMLNLMRKVIQVLKKRLKYLMMMSSQALVVGGDKRSGRPILNHGNMFLNIPAKIDRDTIVASTPTWNDVKKGDIEVI
ncbi:hypothetical protein PanWU01x14_026040 [Parasponia andersonii]|uniref:Uncharacterized protein n=1 Tax=Parasponia andersonii TaxID=3476 RepID=A0A2P5DVW9_PARAD|nr:hypothetical protein PanWU01x14_026040 [Parasponia andersonii]